MALVPKPTDLTDLISLIKNYDVEKLLGINSSEMGSIRTQRIYDLPPVSRAIKSLIEINRFAKDEISRAKKKGRSTTISSTSVPAAGQRCHCLLIA